MKITGIVSYFVGYQYYIILLKVRKFNVNDRITGWFSLNCTKYIDKYNIKT
jgi:hypothetical protein